MRNSKELIYRTRSTRENTSGLVAPRNTFSSTKGGADSPTRIIGDINKNGREVNNTWRHSRMDVDPSGWDNHPGEYVQCVSCAKEPENIGYQLKENYEETEEE
ncbi:reverse transcriptase [Abeliophyllum distichum]|uniref:Reverse transcriptase n=1 Tax=Abeliophyllum distichum TaxID=126358 RepID=A0ABD1TIA8_9LAMI